MLNPLFSADTTKSTYRGRIELCKTWRPVTEVHFCRNFGGNDIKQSHRRRHVSVLNLVTEDAGSLLSFLDLYTHMNAPSYGRHAYYPTHSPVSLWWTTSSCATNCLAQTRA